MDIWLILGVLIGSGGVVAVLGMLGSGIKWLLEARERHQKNHSDALNLFDKAEENYRLAGKAKNQQGALLVLRGKVMEQPILETPHDLLKRAREDLGKAREAGPDCKTEVKILYLQACMLYNKEIYDLCVRRLCKARELNKHLGIGYELLGQAYDALGDKKRALLCYDIYGKLNPDDEKTQSRIEYLRKEVGIVEKPTIWQKLHSVTRRTRLCANLA